MIAKESVGLAIARDHLTIAYARATPFTVQLRAHAVHQLGTASGDAAERMEAVCAAVKAFWRQHRIGDACLWIGVPADLVIQRVLSLPLAARENLGKAIEYELQKYIPRLLEHFVFRYQILAEDRGANRLRILVAAVKKSDLAPLVEARESFHTGIYGVESAATAAMNGLCWTAEEAAESSHGLAYAADRRLHVTYFEDGAPRHVWALDLDDDMAPQTQHLVQELEEIGALRADSPTALHVYCHGPDATEEVLQTLNSSPQLVFVPLPLQEGFRAADMPIVATGLAVKGLQPVDLDVNLFPEQFRQRPSPLGRYVGLALLALALLTGLGWAGSHFLQPRLLDRKVERELGELADEMQALVQVQDEIAELEARVNALAALRQERIDALGFLKELTETVPDSAWLLSLSVAGDKAAIQGIAENSTELIPQLEASPLFSDARFISTITKGREGKDVFKIGFAIEGQEGD